MIIECLEPTCVIAKRAAATFPTATKAPPFVHCSCGAFGENEKIEWPKKIMQ